MGYKFLMSEFGHETCFSQQNEAEVMICQFWLWTSRGVTCVCYLSSTSAIGLPTDPGKGWETCAAEPPQLACPSQALSSQAPCWYRCVSEPSLNQLSHEHRSQDNKLFCSKPLDLANGYGALSFKISWNAKIIWCYLHVCFPLFLGVISSIPYLCEQVETFLTSGMLTFFYCQWLEKENSTNKGPSLLWQTLELGSHHIHSQLPSPLFFSPTKAGGQTLYLPVSLQGRSSQETQSWPVSPEESSVAEVFKKALLSGVSS